MEKLEELRALDITTLNERTWWTLVLDVLGELAAAVAARPPKGDPGPAGDKGDKGDPGPAGEAAPTPAADPQPMVILGERMAKALELLALQPQVFETLQRAQAVMGELLSAKDAQGVQRHVMELAQVLHIASAPAPVAVAPAPAAGSSPAAAPAAGLAPAGLEAEVLEFQRRYGHPEGT